MCQAFYASGPRCADEGRVSLHASCPCQAIRKLQGLDPKLSRHEFGEVGSGWGWAERGVFAGDWASGRQCLT